MERGTWILIVIAALALCTKPGFTPDRTVSRGMNATSVHMAPASYR